MSCHAISDEWPPLRLAHASYITSPRPVSSMALQAYRLSVSAYALDVQVPTCAYTCIEARPTNSWSAQCHRAAYIAPRRPRTPIGTMLTRFDHASVAMSLMTTSREAPTDTQQRCRPIMHVDHAPEKQTTPVLAQLSQARNTAAGRPWSTTCANRANHPHTLTVRSDHVFRHCALTKHRMHATRFGHAR